MVSNDQPERKRIDKSVVFGIVLAVVSFLAALIIAALSLGGVINMATVEICLWFAGIGGVAAIIAGAVWLRTWVREGVRVALAMTACLALLWGMHWLYGWIEKNGHRSNEASGVVQQPIKQEHLPAITQPQSSQPKSVRLHPKPSTHTHANKNPENVTTTNGKQNMTNSPGSVQQSSTGQNSPNINGSGNIVGNTFNIDTHVAPVLTGEMQNALVEKLKPFTGSEVVIYIYNGNEGTHRFAKDLITAMHQASINADLFEGMTIPAPPPGVSCSAGENKRALAEVLYGFLQNQGFMRSPLVINPLPQPDRFTIAIAPW